MNDKQGHVDINTKLFFSFFESYQIMYLIISQMSSQIQKSCDRIIKAHLQVKVNFSEI